MPPPGSRDVFARPRDTMRAIVRVLGYFRPHAWRLALVALGLALGTFGNVYGTYLLKPVLNDHIIPWIGKPDADMSGLVRILQLMVGVYLAGGAGLYLYRFLMIRVSTGILLQLRREMFARTQRLPIVYFDQRTHGQTMSRFTNDVDVMREMLGHGLPEFVHSTLRMLGVFAMMLVLSPFLTLLAVVMLAFMTWLVRFLARRSSFYFKGRQGALGALNGFIEEMVEGQKVVRVFNHQAFVRQRFEELNEDLRRNDAGAWTFGSILMPLMGNLSHVLFAVTAAVGGILAVRSILDLGTLAAFLQYTRNFAMPVTQLSQQFNSIMSALAGAERIFNLLDEPEEQDSGSVALVDVTREEGGRLVASPVRTGLWAWKIPPVGAGDPPELRPLQGDVRFTDVFFSYDGRTPVLRGISLFARPGQKIALVGSTGAGKTTIANLLNRFYEIDQGEITYDGISLDRIRKTDLRRSLGMVLQDTHLFTGTVRENIRYGRLEATDEEVEQAARLANADGFIRHLPKGYDTELSADGVNLSQGQRQLLAIARTAVADPPVLILDEATSSIDTRTEALIEKGMDRLMHGRTVFVIAHRLSTVRHCDAILVMEHGEILERGTHEDLLALEGRYHKLYTGVFELE
ncbi:MAG: ABC transporter ATP-binding protein [Candidatus Xenobium sp.]|jgi:ATP-binding cassette subfamily B multidrug efflux pump